MSQILTVRGDLYAGVPEPFDPEKTGSILSNAMRALGIVSKLSFEPSVERVKVLEWSSGNDSIAESWSRVTGGKIKIMADEASPDNLALNLAGRVRVIGPESVTNAKIAVKDADGKYSELTTTTALKATTPYYFVRSIAENGLSYQPYELIDTTTFVLTDSSGTPKTLVAGTDYTIDAQTGKLILKGTAGHGVNLSGLTYPLSADFDMGLFIDEIPRPLIGNKPYMLSQKKVTGVVVKDSSATPKIIDDAYYTVDSDYGMLAITNRTAIMAVSGLTLPLKVYGTQGDVTAVGLLTEGIIEHQIRMNGINVRTKQKMAITFYRVSFDSTAVDFFDKDYTKVALEGELMRDASRPEDDLLGQFGKIEYL